MRWVTQPPHPMNPGRAEPRHLILPEGIVSTGWPAVRDTCSRVGIAFDSWQQELNKAILAKDYEGLYAADTVVMSICRQSGKTYDVGGIVFADSIIHPGTTTVWTAHRFKVSRESFNDLRALASTSRMAPHVDTDEITTGAGNECITFRNGSRIVFAARERGAVRGFSKVRRLVLDEAQILTEATMSDLVPTTNHADNPQIILMGTPPRPKDPGEVFTSLRKDALEGVSDGVLYVEFAADPDCDLDDWDAVVKANPSFPHRTPRRAVMRLRKLLTNDDDYRREGLGIWQAAGSKQVIPAVSWGDRYDEDSQPAGQLAIGFEVSPDRAGVSVALGGQRTDGEWHVELDECRDGVIWLVPYLTDLLSLNMSIRAVVADAKSVPTDLVDDLESAGIRVTYPTVMELGTAHGQLLSGVVSGTVRHIGQPQLSLAVSVAGKRPLGDTGMWVFSRSNASADITPVQAATLALMGAQAAKPKRPMRKKSTRREAVVL